MTTGTTERPWHYGVKRRTIRTVAPTELPITVEQFTTKVLKSPNGNEEDSQIESWLLAATARAEHDTQMALMPQTWTLVMDGFPASRLIVLERPPLIGYPTIAYYDEDNEQQTMDGSPAVVDVATSGKYSKAEIRPLDGEEWPATYARLDAVTVTYEAGFEDMQDATFQQIVAGIGFMVQDWYDRVESKVDWRSLWPRFY